MVAVNCCCVPSAIDGLVGVTPTPVAETHAPVVVLQCGALDGHWLSAVQWNTSASGCGFGASVTSGGGLVVSGGVVLSGGGVLSGGVSTRTSGGGGFPPSASG